MHIWQKIKKQFVANSNMLWGITRSFWNDPNAWESSIRTFEAEDRRKPSSEDIIVFAGSSSFTFWSTVERDLAPLPVLNRGFGGARLQDVLQYVERILRPHHPRAVVLFVGTNDIAWPKPATAQEVFDGYRALVQGIQSMFPKTPIYYIAITPTLARWKYWSIAQEANRLIREHTQSESRLHFIDLTDHLLGPDGKPDRSLYRFDGLHPNQEGYVKWVEVIKPILMKDLL